MKKISLIGKKIRMSNYFYEKHIIACTIIQVLDTIIIKQKQNGNFICFTQINKKLKKPQFMQINNFIKYKINKKKGILHEIILNKNWKINNNIVNLVTVLEQVNNFNKKIIDIQSKSKGHGFSGVMKRWNFHGGNATHGASKSHRRIGSLGGKKVWKGQLMPGRYGNKNIYIRNNKILFINKKKKILIIKGSIAGKNNSIIKCIFRQNEIKKARFILKNKIQILKI